MDLTCGVQYVSGASSSSYDDCGCVFAETLIGEGLLTCEDADLCPQECPVCAICLALLCEGIPPDGLTGQSDFMSRPALMYVLAAVAGFLLISLALYYARRRRNDNKDLSKSLMDTHDKGGTMYISDGTYDGVLSHSDESSSSTPAIMKSHQNIDTILPVGTMSTSGTSVRRPGGSAGRSILPPPSDDGSVDYDESIGGGEIPTSFDATGVQLDLETGMVSPMPTVEGTSSDGDTNSSHSDLDDDEDNQDFQRGMDYFEKYAAPDDDVLATRAEFN